MTVGFFNRPAPPSPERTTSQADAYVSAAIPRLMGAALSLTGNRHDAEDLVQDTLAKVLVHWRKVERADSPDAYVRKVMVNTFVSGKRRRSSSEVVSHVLVTADGSATADAQVGPEDRDEMWTLLAGLSPRQRAVLVLRYYDDLPDAAIADVLGCSPVSVRVTAHKALARLREQMPGLGDSGPCPEPTGAAVTTSR
ncbi:MULTISPECIES: SigE family RNA polymerase sigma factor [unclassified Phycicoccus]|uniref:SigE family RNA polymerase sigma factor n=1 Tax=unclassified Phycicoccus TaxID=2637926 RepID=UPI001910576C|nr:MULTISPECIES: SigE family RNA polymerase sigma factor [unclassified Phycicoccus]